MLSVYFSVLVVGLVLLGFFFVSWLSCAGFPKRGETAEAVEETAVRPAVLPVREKTVSGEAPAKAEPVKEKVPEETRELEIEETKIFEKEEVTGALERPAAVKSSGRFALEAEPEILGDEESPEHLEEYFVRHFLNQYGAVSRTVAQDTRTVTHHLIRRICEAAGAEAPDVLMHLMVQEALQNAQRAYAMLPNETVLGMLGNVFLDVATGNKTDTRTILACDALKAMPRMEMGQFRALALLLLFHYSRNTDNVDAASLKAYADKYVEPLFRQLPDEYSGYQQLEYLHCISLQNKDAAFGQVLRDSYPLIFAFRGCMKTELEGIRAEWAEGAIVPSLFNSYYKVAAVDESALPDFFEKYGIEDPKEQTLLNALLHSRPVPYDRKETEKILERISPALSGLQETWDNSLLRRSSLTLMGMYIAQIYIREVIGEEFDLAHWM